MSFNEPREVNGENVRGSDLDMIVLRNNGSEADAVVAEFDRALHFKKYMLLKVEREEIDYIVKGMEAVKRQAAMGSPRDMIASKIILESIIIFGNSDLYLQAQDLQRSSRYLGTSQGSHSALFL